MVVVPLRSFRIGPVRSTYENHAGDKVLLSGQPPVIVGRGHVQSPVRLTTCRSAKVASERTTAARRRDAAAALQHERTIEGTGIAFACSNDRLSRFRVQSVPARVNGYQTPRTTISDMC